MAYSKNSKSAAVRAKLGHPVIDGDGHWLEPVPIFLDFLRDVGGPSIVDKFMKKAKDTSWYEMAPAERMERRPHRPTWWGEPGNSLDRATAMVPRLFYERLDDFGIDFAMVYTSLGLFYVSNPDEELRRAVARAVNRMNAEMFRPYAHRMTPAAVVPMYTPAEAIEEATYAVRELGPQGHHDRQPRAPSRARRRAGGEGSRRPRAPLHRFPRAREPVRLRSVLGAVRRAQGGGDGAFGQHGMEWPRVHQQLHVQPHRPLRQCQPRLRQGAHPGRRHPSLSAAPLRLSRGRRGLGVQPGRRPDRPLGAAAPGRRREPGAPDQPRPSDAEGSLRPLRGPRLRGEDGRAARLPEPGRALQDGGGDDRARLSRRASTTSPRCPRPPPRSCAGTSPSASTSAARPTT